MYYVPCFLPLRYVYCLEGIIFYLFFNIYFLRTKYYGGLVTKSCPTLVTSPSVACQAPLSTGFSRQEHWSGLPFIFCQIFFLKGEGNPGRQAVSIPVVGKVPFLCTWINWHQISRSPANIHWVHVLEFVQIWGPWHGRVLGPAALRTYPGWWWPSQLFPPWDPT